MTQKSLSTLSKKSPWETPIAPLVFLVLLVVAFGALIPWLGFYWDDWPVLLHAYMGDATAFRDAYVFDRPLSYWTYQLMAPLFGTHPTGWQLVALGLRYVTVLLLWAVFRQIWPQYRREVAWSALLFAVYPVFTQQAISVAYSQHWLTFALFLFSILAMLLSTRKTPFAPLWVVIGLVTTVLHLITMEYFWGLELLRPFILWFALVHSGDDRRSSLIRVLRAWSLYVIVLLGAILWRLFFIQFPGGDDPNSPIVLKNLLSAPIQTIITTLQNIIQDTGHMLVATWFGTFQPIQITLRPDFLALAWAIVFIVIAGLVFYLTRRPPTPPEASELNKQWLSQALVLGIAFVILGPLPTWIIDKQVLVGLYANRFALAAMPGLALIWIAVLEWALTRRLARAIVLSVLIGLAIGFHLRTANEFRHIWDKQTSFYWQLFWRAPSLDAATLILSDGEIFNYVGHYSTSAGINLLYSDGQDSRTMDYWFVDLQNPFSHGVKQWYERSSFEDTIRAFRFTGKPPDNVVISFEPENGQCLWLLGPSDGADILLSDFTREALQYSRLDRIGAEPASPDIPPTSIFGPEPHPSWCTYFQKADLAAQFSDWDEVLALEKQAAASGSSPGNPRELLPFIKAHARVDDWEGARSLTIQATRVQPRLKRLLCSAWDELDRNVPSSADHQPVILDVYDRLGCIEDNPQDSG